jgi:hypothetical protein
MSRGSFLIFGRTVNVVYESSSRGVEMPIPDDMGKPKAQPQEQYWCAEHKKFHGECSAPIKGGQS